MTCRAAKCIVTVVVTYLLSSSLFVDGVTTPDDSVVSLASEGAPSPTTDQSAGLGEGENEPRDGTTDYDARADAGGIINLNLIDLADSPKPKVPGKTPVTPAAEAPAAKQAPSKAATRTNVLSQTAPSTHPPAKKAPAKVTPAAPMREATMNPLRRFGTEQIVKQVESKAQKKIRKAKEKQHKADVKVARLEHSLKQEKEKETKALKEAEAAEAKAHDNASALRKQAAKKEQQHASTKGGVKKQAVLVAHTHAQLDAAKHVQALAAEQKAEAVDKKDSRINVQLPQERHERAAEHKVLVKAKQRTAESSAMPKVVNHQQAELVPKPSTDDVAEPPPQHGLSDNAQPPDSELKAQMAAMQTVRMELKPKPNNAMMESKDQGQSALQPAAAAAHPHSASKHHMQVKKSAKRTSHNGHQREEHAKDLMKAHNTVGKAKNNDQSCLNKAGECDPEACLCRKGKLPIPLKQARAEGLIQSQDEVGKAKNNDQSCLNKAGECDPEACLCRKGKLPIPLKQARAEGLIQSQDEVGKAKNNDQSCLNKAGECDPEACLCKAGHKPVPLKHNALKHNTHVTGRLSQAVLLGVEGPTGNPATPTPADAASLVPKASSGLKPGEFERYPNFPNHPVLNNENAAEEKYAEDAVQKFTHFKHPDALEKKMESLGEKGKNMAHTIYEEIGKVQQYGKAGMKWNAAAQAEIKAGNVKAERLDADHAWDDVKNTFQGLQKIPDLVQAAWPEKRKFRIPIIEFGAHGKPMKPIFTEPPPNRSLPKDEKETPTEALARKVAFDEEKSHHFSAAAKRLMPQMEKTKGQNTKRQEVSHGKTAKFIEKHHIQLPQEFDELLISEDESHTTNREHNDKVEHTGDDYVRELKKVAARGAAAIGLAVGHEEQRLVLKQKITKAESRALGEAARRTKVKFDRKSKQLAEREEKLNRKEAMLHGEAAAQREIFKVQQKSEAHLAAEVNSASRVSELRKEEMKIVRKKAALDAQASIQSAIFNKQLHNSKTLKAEVKVVGKAEKDALANAVKLGELKAHVEDQAHIILAARAQKRHEKADERTSKWTMKHTAALGKLMVVTREVDRQLAQKKQRLKQVGDQLSLLHKRLIGVADGNQKVQSEDNAIRESTEEMSREELGEVNKDEQEEDLGESMDSSHEDTDDDLGSSLATMAAKFAAIQRTMASASAQEKSFEKDIADKRVSSEKALKHKVAQTLKKHSEKGANLLTNKKQRELEKKLEKEEARLRMTTVSKVHAQFKLQNAVDDERAEKGKEARKLRGAVSRLTPQMETRLEYQRMYLQNAMQQAQQENDDLQNKLSNIKGADAQKLQQFTLDIREKHQSLKDDLSRVQTLASEYERDHDMGEGLSSKNGAKSLSDAQAKQEMKDIKDESFMVDTAHSLSQKLADMQDDTQAPLIKSAQALLGVKSSDAKSQLGESSEIRATDTDDVNGSLLGAPQIQLAAKISMAKTALKLKLDKFAALRRRESELSDEAARIQHAATEARNAEYDAQTRTAAMRKIAKQLTDGISRHEESMELGETLFSRKRKVTLTHRNQSLNLIVAPPQDEDMDNNDLGESSDTKSTPDLPPIQAELNYEHEKLAEAEAEIHHLAIYGPKIVKEQIAEDKKRYGSVLRKEEAKLNALHKRFTKAAAMLSPKIRSQQLLDDAVRDEESREQDYAHYLDNIASYASMVDRKSRAAESAAENLDELPAKSSRKTAQPTPA